MITQISNTTPVTTNPLSATQPGRNDFANEFMQVQQQLATSLPSTMPPSAYVARTGAYSVDTHGSHIVNGVQLIPGAPGYNPAAAMPYLNQIVQTQQNLYPAHPLSTTPTPLSAAITPEASQDNTPEIITHTSSQPTLESISTQLSQLSANLVNKQPTTIINYLNQIKQIETMTQQLNALQAQTKEAA